MRPEPSQTEWNVRVERVLACVGASPWLESQVGTVTGLAEALDARVTFLHVCLPGSNADVVRDRIRAALDARSPTGPSGGSEDAGRTEVDADGRTEVLTISSRHPDRTILREATRRGVDLVYAGAAPHEPVLTDIMGSTARRIARNARCSVLLDPNQSGRDGRFPIAVVALRTDAPSRALGRFAINLARRGVIGQVHFVHEIQPAPHSAVRADSGQAWRIATARADAELRELVSSIDPSGVDIRTLCVEGRNRSGVAAHARSVGADLVVCDGPRNRIRTLGRLLGDEYESLLTDLPSALLLAQIRRGGDSRTGPAVRPPGDGTR